jgi:PmbA protein
MEMLDRLTAEAEQVEVVELHSEVTVVGYEANRLKSSRVEETRGHAVRVVKDGRLGFSASTDPSAIGKLVTNVLESAAYGDEVPLSFPAPQAAPAVTTFDPTISELPTARLVEIGQEILAPILEVEPEARINLELQRGVERFLLRNQAGADVAFERSPLSISYEVSRIQGDDVVILFGVDGTTTWQEDYLAFAHRLARRLQLAQKSAKLRSGRMPVLFAPEGALVLAVPLVAGLNGKSVYTQNSPMAGRVGETLFDAKLTAVDDATLDGRFGSAPYDDEGVAHHRHVMVENGVLRGFMYDLKTAVQSGVESTGNGSRSLFSPPSPSSTNFVLEPGDTPLAEIIAGIDEGLLADTALGLGQGNVVSGAFSNSLGLAFKIEGGEIVGRVKDVSIAGNIYELLQDVAAVSQETEWIYYNYRLPYILLPEMNVVTAQ